MTSPSEEVVELSLAELVFDYDLYPRTDVDSTHVTRMREAERAGVKFGPYIIEQGSNRVVDGFHRGKKDRLEHGDDHRVRCIARQYASDGELFVDAMQCNASHGRPLSPFDRCRCALKCKKLRVAAKSIAAALGMTPAALKAIAEGRTARAGNGDGKSAQREVALKQTITHMSGKTLTPEQEGANQKLSGMRQGFYVNQLLLLIENDLLDREDDKLMGQLRQLYDCLGPIVG